MDMIISMIILKITSFCQNHKKNHHANHDPNNDHHHHHHANYNPEYWVESLVIMASPSKWSFTNMTIATIMIMILITIITWSSGPSFTSVRINLPLSSEHLTIFSLQIWWSLVVSIAMLSYHYHRSPLPHICIFMIILSIVKRVNVATCTAWACSWPPRPPRREQLMLPEASQSCQCGNYDYRGNCGNDCNCCNWCFLKQVS